MYNIFQLDADTYEMEGTMTKLCEESGIAYNFGDEVEYSENDPNFKKTVTLV
jgi:hypothetical protein